MTLGTVVVGGGTGFIGNVICKKLQQIGYQVFAVSRKPKLNSISWNEIESHGLPEDCVAVLNVAGQNVLDPRRRWTPGFQQNVYASRVHTTKFLADEIQKMKNPPKVFGIITGVGFYAPSETEIYTESSPGGTYDSLSRLVKAWEEASVLPPDLNVRRFVVRSGVVLGRSGGLIRQVFWPFYFGLGGRVASGKQFFPWIHIEDLAGFFLHGIRDDRVEGVYNGVCPDIVTNGEFTKALARAMWRPAVLPMPEFFLNLAFGEERAAMMVKGQKVVPKRTLESGYEFLCPTIEEACEDCARVFIDDKS